MTNEDLRTLATAFEPGVKRRWFRALVAVKDIETEGVESLEAFYRKEAEKAGSPIPAPSQRVEQVGGFEAPEGLRSSDFVLWAWDWWAVEFDDVPVPTVRAENLTIDPS